MRIGAPPAAAAAPINESALSENERLGLSALKLRESPEYRAEKERRPYREEARGLAALVRSIQTRKRSSTWAMAPVVNRAVLPAAFAAPLATRLAGRVAVGVIMVSGPDSSP